MKKLKPFSKVSSFKNGYSIPHPLALQGRGLELMLLLQAAAYVKWALPTNSFETTRREIIRRVLGCRAGKQSATRLPPGEMIGQGVNKPGAGFGHSTLIDPGRSTAPVFPERHYKACFWPFGSADRRYRPPRTSL